MTQPKCREVELLIDREAHGWSQAERLRVEQHLEACGGCRESVAVARLVRETLRDASGELSEAARARAIQRALVNGTSRARVRGAPGRARLVWTLGGVAAAAAIAMAVLSMRATHEVASRAPTLVVPSPKQLEAPATQDEQQPAPVPPAAAAVWIEASGTERHAFAHAQVELEAATRVRFDAEQRALHLERGRVDVDVDASQGQQFSVVTKHFRVVVLGTRFVVTPDSVLVKRGRVQVLASDGSVLASSLAAGAAFSYGPAEPASGLGVTGTVPARVWLARAREALAQGQTRHARELVAHAEDSAPQRADRAEASTLRAEAALLDHYLSAALRLYVSVFERFSDLTAGENAAFAAAQLAARSDSGRERSLLLRYAARYPRGRFADEAKLRLEKLPAR